MNYCEWQLEDSESSCFETECEEMFNFISDGIKENNFKFCPFCGKEIKEINNE